jgi:hypothetical protein
LPEDQEFDVSIRHLVLVCVLLVSVRN